MRRIIISCPSKEQVLANNPPVSENVKYILTGVDLMDLNKKNDQSLF